MNLQTQWKPIEKALLASGYKACGLSERRELIAVAHNDPKLAAAGQLETKKEIRSDIWAEPSPLLEKENPDPFAATAVAEKLGVTFRISRTTSGRIYLFDAKLPEAKEAKEPTRESRRPDTDGNSSPA